MGDWSHKLVRENFFHYGKCELLISNNRLACPKSPSIHPSQTYGKAYLLQKQTCNMLVSKCQAAQIPTWFASCRSQWQETYLWWIGKLIKPPRKYPYQRPKHLETSKFMASSRSQKNTLDFYDIVKIGPFAPFCNFRWFFQGEREKNATWRWQWAHSVTAKAICLYAVKPQVSAPLLINSTSNECLKVSQS